MSGIDITLLQLFSCRDKYEKMSKAVPTAALGDVTKVLLADYGKYYTEFPDVHQLDPGSFFTWFKAFAHPNWRGEQLDKYKPLIDKIAKPVAPELEEGLAARLVAAGAALKIQDMLEAYNEGAEIDLGSTLRNIVDEYDQDSNRKVKTPWVRDNIEDLLEDDATGRGFKFRVDELNDAMRPLASGDFGIVAARPDVGKTTWLTDNLTYFASQMQDVFPDEGRNILWFNNEGPGRRIKKRCYQSALNATYSDLLSKQSSGTLRLDYEKAMGGDEDVLRIMDVHDFWNYEVEDIIRQHNPGIIVFDMLDNIKFGGVGNNNGQRTDQLLEAMYQWGRIMAVKYDCVVLATSQISADGEGMCYPGLGMLKDSKTGKQGAADFILTIGYQTATPETRYMGLTKNKLAREGGPRTLQQQLIFDGQRGRYVKPKLVDDPSDEAKEDPLA